MTGETQSDSLVPSLPVSELALLFFARSLAKPKDFAHVFNSIYVINCLTSLVSTMTDVSKKLYQSLKQNKMTQSPGGKKKKESIGLKEK